MRLGVKLPECLIARRRRTLRYPRSRVEFDTKEAARSALHAMARANIIQGPDPT
jgi:hypothetical protein